MTVARRPLAGPRIQREREALGLTREGLAHYADVSLRAVQRIEQGECVPQRSTLAAIDRALTDYADRPAAA